VRLLDRLDRVGPTITTSTSSSARWAGRQGRLATAAAQCDDGNVATGADATALLLEALRPDAVAAATWTQLAAAAARGLGRWAPAR